VGSTSTSVKQRRQEHTEDPESAVYQEMQEMEEKGEPTVELEVAFPCFSNDELVQCEKKYIKAYTKKYGKDRMLNKNMTGVVKQKNTIEIKVERKLYTDKFKVTDSAGKQCLRLRYRTDGKRKEECFQYRSQSKQEALAKAQTRQSELSKFFDWS
jgi:hypothetical protein